MGFCPYCKPQIKPIREPLCKRCGKAIRQETEEYCYDCQQKQHFFQQGRGVYQYEGPMKKAMYRLKYSNRRRYAEVIAKDAMRYHGRWISEIGVEALVPVPVHPNKLRRRGYNQAEVLARAISEQSGIPVATLVERVVDTLPQKEMTAENRGKNLKNAFKVVNNGLKYKKVLIIDDIYTTGATVDSIAKILLDRGIVEVYCLYGCIGRGY